MASVIECGDGYDDRCAGAQPGLTPDRARRQGWHQTDAGDWYCPTCAAAETQAKAETDGGPKWASVEPSGAEPWHTSRSGLYRWEPQ